MFDCRIKHGACYINSVAGVQQPGDVLERAGALPAPVQ
jgi:hypothetical protein